MCPSKEAGAGLAPACWPDQKPVRPSRGVTRHSPAARGSTPQTGTGFVPQHGWRSIGMLADQLDYVIGVDPHRDLHAVAIVEARTGVVVFESTVSADKAGYAEALRLAEQHAPARRGFAVEGTSSYGAGLSRFLADHGEQVFEVSRLRRERRSGGKTDALDAVRAARSVLTLKRPAIPRASGEREALRVLMATREGAIAARTAALCQLRDLIVTAPESLRSQLRPLTRARLLTRLAAARPERRQGPRAARHPPRTQSPRSTHSATHGRRT